MKDPMMTQTAKRSFRMALAGVALIIVAGISLAVTTVASAIEYNLLEDQGFYSNPDQVGSGASIGIYLGMWAAVILGALGLVFITLALVHAARGIYRQPSPTQGSIRL
jgi:hypothetical protein